MMKMEEYLPHRSLSDYVKCYRFFESEEESLNNILPSTSMAISFKIRGYISYAQPFRSISIPKNSLLGIRNNISVIKYSPSTLVLVVFFKEMGLSAFVKENLFGFYEQCVELEHFMGKSDVEEFEEILGNLSDNSKRVEYLDRFLFSKLLADQQDPLITAAISRIYLAQGFIRINELVKELNISQDAFSKRFRKVVGCTAKRFAELIRINSLLSADDSFDNISKIAIGRGYFDQAHFIKDFKNFTGTTPKQFKVNDYWINQ